MQIQQLPSKPNRKQRRPEEYRFVVKWIQGDTMFFQWFKRNANACAFLNKLLDAGLEARVLRK